jgi:hypothetical protein
MVTFRSNNNRRPSFRSNNNRRPQFRRNNDEGSKFHNNDNFHRKGHDRNNFNAAKLIEKYNDLAREALAHEDKILSENYYQHADHFTRIQNEQESNRIARMNSSSTENPTPNTTKTEIEDAVKTKEVKEITSKPEIKNTEKKTAEKKSVAG